MTLPGSEVALLSHGSKKYFKTTILKTWWAGEDLEQYKNEVRIKISAGGTPAERGREVPVAKRLSSSLSNK